MSATLTLKNILLNRKSNESLMLRYADSGDSQLLTKLYDACGNDLYHFVLTLSDPVLAKDICQVTWLKVIEKKHLYGDSGQFKAWLFTLARNQLIDDIRKVKNTTNDPEYIIAQQIASQKNASSEIDSIEISCRFDQALITLPFAQREAFCLQQEGFSLQDIATITHSTSETVKSRLRYAKDNLRTQLTKEYGQKHG